MELGRHLYVDWNLCVVVGCCVFDKIWWGSFWGLPFSLWLAPLVSNQKKKKEKTNFIVLSKNDPPDSSQTCNRCRIIPSFFFFLCYCCRKKPKFLLLKFFKHSLVGVHLLILLPFSYFNKTPKSKPNLKSYTQHTPAGAYSCTRVLRV